MTNEKEYTRMNILFFITPKSETAYLYDDCSLRQAIEKIEYHKYTAVPVLNKKGCYVGTLTEGDLLRIIKERYLLNYQEEISSSTVIRKAALKKRKKPGAARGNKTQNR